jgi:AcrR family transcriptional regulator
MPLTSRQQQIIEASTDLIALRGIQEMTMKKIAERVGISEPAIYRHFASKNEILNALLETFGRENEAIFEQAARGEGRTLDRLSSAFDSLLLRFAERPAIASVIFAEDIFRNDPRLVETLHAIQERSRRRLLAIVETGIVRGELRQEVPADQMCLILMGALRLLVLRWRFSACRFDLVAAGRDLWASIRLLIVSDEEPVV